MKRDMDLIRTILLTVEDDPELDGGRFKTFSDADFPGHSKAEIVYHIDLLFEAGLVEGIKTMDPDPALSRLTWSGHEFISAARDPGVWQKVKDRIKGIPDVGFSLLTELVTAELKAKLLHQS